MLFHDLVEENGRTIRENNLTRKHKFPVGALVEVTLDEWLGGGACWHIQARLWVVQHVRDCDGEPLYTLSDKRPYRDYGRWFYGIGEEQLRQIRLTKALEAGEVVPDWLVEG